MDSFICIFAQLSISTTVHFNARLMAKVNEVVKENYKEY